MIQRAEELFGPGARTSELYEVDGEFLAGKKKFVWPGRSLELSSVPNDVDVRRHKGRPHDHIGFDELSEFTQFIYDFLGIWCRTPHKDQRTSICSGTNPPTSIEGRWIIEHWAPWLDERHPKPAASGELRWFAMLPGGVNGELIDTEVDGPNPIPLGGEMVVPSSRTFVPARVQDNPVYMASGYAQQLQRLSGVLRDAYYLGDFRACMKDDAMQAIPTAWITAAFERWRALPANAKLPPLTCVGMDVAHGGRDRTVLYPRHHNIVPRPRIIPGVETPTSQASANHLVSALIGGGYGNVDTSEGYGAAAADWADALLRDEKLKGRVHGVNFGARTNLRDRTKLLTFRNVRAYSFFALRDALDPEDGDSLAIEPVEGLLQELTAFRYEVTPTGIVLEDKDEIKKRIKRSPDLADGLALTYSVGPYGAAKDTAWLELAKKQREEKALAQEKARAGRT